ncbi:hypothetical protein FRB90_004737 [Tulasnella sp. 427]|nr:hypothetical protein FRB90_004737 [Tulasnella sp. 427]
MEKAAPLFGGSGGFLLLEHLNLSGFPISLASLKVSCLKSLSLKRIALVSDDDILQLLACSTGLESLSLDWPDNSGWPNVTREPPTVPFINLSSLRDFKLTQSPPPFARLLLSAILVPVLQTFEIGGGHYTHPVTDILNPHLPHLANTLYSMINDVEIVAVEINRTQCVVQAGQVTIRTVHPKNNESLTRTINPALKWLQGLGGRIGQVPLHVYVAEDYGGLDGDIWD